MAARLPFKWPVVVPVIALCVGMGMKAHSYQDGYKAAERAINLKWQNAVAESRVKLVEAQEAKRKAEIAAQIKLQKMAQEFLAQEAQVNQANQDKLDALRRAIEAEGKDPVFNIPEPQTLTCPDPKQTETPRVLKCPKVSCPVCRFGGNRIPRNILRNFD